MSATQPMEDSTAAVRALDLPPKRERLGVVLVAPTQGGQAYQIDGGRLAPEMAAACVARDYSADAQEVAARYADWRILVMPPVALRAIPRASDLSARIFGVPVIELRAARTPEGGTHGG